MCETRKFVMAILHVHWKQGLLCDEKKVFYFADQKVKLKKKQQKLKKICENRTENREDKKDKKRSKKRIGSEEKKMRLSRILSREENTLIIVFLFLWRLTALK